MKKTTFRVAALAALVALAGCVTTPEACDVHQKDASFVNKLSCRDADKQAVADRERALQIAREENAAFRQILADLKAEQADVGKTLAEQQKIREQSRTSLRAMLGKVKARKGHSAEVQQQIADLEQQLQAQSQLPASNSAAAMKKREAERDELQRKVRQLQMSLGY